MAQEETNLSEADKQKLLDDLKNEALTHLTKAIELDKQAGHTEEAQQAKADACALLLVAIRAGVQFDPQDPIFQVFAKKPSWRNAMSRACKSVCSPKSARRRRLIKILKALPTISVEGSIVFLSVTLSDNPGDFLEKFYAIFEKDGINPLEKDETRNIDLWSDFYEEIPKGGGDGPSHCSNLMQSKKTLQGKLKDSVIKSMAKNKPHQKVLHGKLQKYLSGKMTKDQPVIASRKRQRASNVA